MIYLIPLWHWGLMAPQIYVHLHLRYDISHQIPHLLPDLVLLFTYSLAKNPKNLHSKHQISNSFRVFNMDAGPPLEIHFQLYVNMTYKGSTVGARFNFHKNGASSVRLLGAAAIHK